MSVIDQPYPVFDPSGMPNYGAGMSDVWSTSLETVAPGVSSAVASQQSTGESWTDTLARILPMLTATYQQRQIHDIQLQRAKAGLPPLSNSDFGSQVSVGLDPQTRQYLVIGGVALIGLIAFGVFKKGK